MKAVEFCSVMPCFPSTSAIAEMSASVFLLRSFVRTCSIVRSGMTSVKSLTCLTWPAMTALGGPGPREPRIQAPSWPSGIHSTVVPPSSAASASISGNALALDGDHRDVVPELPRCPEHQKRETAVAGNQADRQRSHSTSSVSSTRLDGRRRMTPRRADRMKLTR